MLGILWREEFLLQLTGRLSSSLGVGQFLKLVVNLISSIPYASVQLTS
ncbi:hypothetical protein NOC27_2460 [Nitrosococcus oceani AFC27]|nr:hypothetical protein NOC27_2460 [Nitrosococcus oceani AFC27]